ncbi:unnamed protein product [Leptosia nina]|uniref:Uncharacterized protein n=1 Tax=Leptosia nina TaxID=320188 RepID=A0AAV1K5L2_9NEOP
MRLNAMRSVDSSQQLWRFIGRSARARSGAKRGGSRRRPANIPHSRLGRLADCAVLHATVSPSPRISRELTSHFAIVRIKDSPKSNAEGGGKKESKKKSGKQKKDDNSVTNNKVDKSERCAVKTEKDNQKRSTAKNESNAEASPENSRNASPRYHDASMDDASDAGSLFRVTSGAGGGGGKSELVARGGSGGALALSRAPVGGSASPAPAPLPQPAPSPAPAALPPPALPPPPFRADTPHRPNGAHIPAIDGQAATQIPARPVGAAGPDTPERPASNNKLQPGARAAADSPTPAPPAPPAPSPLFPSHTAYQAHAAALPDFRLTNHETRTEPPAAEQAHAPLDLHAHHSSPRPPQVAPTANQPVHPSLPNRAPHPQPHTVVPGHEVRSIPAAQPHPPVPTSYPSRVAPNVPQNNVPQMPMPTTTGSNCLPSQVQAPAPRSASPAASSRPYPTPIIGSSHGNSSISSNIHHAIPGYPSQANLQKHSVPYAGRPSHLAPFSVANHISSSHLPSTKAPTPTHLSHPINSHSILNHTSHIPMTAHPLASTPSHVGQPLFSTATATSTISSLTPSMKPQSLLPPPMTPSHPTHMDTSPVTSAPAIITSSSSNHLPPPVVDTRSTVAEMQSRSDSVAVVSSSLAPNGYPTTGVYSNAYPTLYAPYAPTLQHSPYLPPSAASPRNTADTRTSLAASPLVAPKTPKGVRPHTPGSLGGAGVHAPLSYSPRTQSPSRERESFSNISSLSRSTPASAVSAPSSAPSLVPTMPAPLAAPLAGPLAASLPAPLAAPLPAPLAAPLPGPVPSLSGPVGLAPQVGGLSALTGLANLAAPTPTAPQPAPHISHSLAPVPTVPSISSSAKPPAHWGVTPAPTERSAAFAPAPPLFGAPLAPNPNPFSAESLFQSSPGADLLRRELDNRFLAAAGAVGVRTELHHHQHQHTHVHQHPPHAPPHPHQLLVPHAPLFKDVGKMSPLYRSGLGLYPYSSSLLHPAAPYVPPAPLTTYAPKPVVSSSDSTPKLPPRPAIAKTGKWNAMHVRIAWEIYNHQQKEKSGGGGVPAMDKDKLRSFPAPAPPPPTYRSPYDLPPPYLHHAPLGIVRHPSRAPYGSAPLGAPERELGVPGVSPFTRYGGTYPGAPPYGLSYGRELGLAGPLHGVHHPLGMHDAWRAVRPPVSTAAEVRREHEERERARREREERERRDREERERRKAREQRERDLERARTRSPLRNGVTEQPKDERKEPPRPPTLPYPPPHWDPYRAAFDPLQHMRFAPLVEAAIRAEEDRAKMLSAYAHHQQLKSSPLLHHRGPVGAPLPPMGAHMAPLAPLAPPMAPLAPLDLLKKEEPR